MPPRTERARMPARPVIDFPDEPPTNVPPPCEQAAATRELAEEVAKLRAAFTDAAEKLEPALETIAGFGGRLDALCRWLKKYGPWLLASAPGVLVAIGAISPNAAAALKIFLAGFGS